MEETRGGPRLPHRLCSGAAARHHRRRSYQPGAGADREAARLRRDHRRSAHGICLGRALPRREGDRRMAGHGAAAAQCRSLHGVRRAHPRPEDRRSGAASTRSRRDCFYIGALGSRKTHARRIERLKAQGIGDAALARIHAPIGLEIGAVSPAEIAVAIMAEITAAVARSGGSGQSGRLRHEIRSGGGQECGRRTAVLALWLDELVFKGAR